MKKLFQLTVEGRNRDRLLDASKHEVRKYVARQRRAALPEGVDYWDFDCKFGPSEDKAQSVHLATLTGLMDSAAAEGAAQCYVEIVAKHGHRQARPADASTPATTADTAEQAPGG